MAETTKVKRHPLAIAWDKWLATKEGAECRAANTLAHNTNVYLENRLHRAFMAGADASGGNSEQFEALRKAAEDALDFIEAIGRDIHYVYSPEAAANVSHVADNTMTALRNALGKE